MKLRLCEAVSAGYTLLEVMLWCSVLGICAGILVNVAQWHDHALVRNEIDTLYYVLVAHTFRACAEDCVCDIVMDERGWKAHNETHELADDVVFGVMSGCKGPPSDPTSYISYPITFSHQRIRLYPDGKIQPGTVYFTDKSLRVGYAISCPVGKISYIRRYRYTAGTWSAL